jgi:hypothetical protein
MCQRKTIWLADPGRGARGEQLALLQVGMELHLVDDRRDAAPIEHEPEQRAAGVAEPDRAHESGVDEPLHRLPGTAEPAQVIAVPVPDRVVQQEQIQVVQAHAIEGLVGRGRK